MTQPENTLICPRCKKLSPEGWTPCEGSCYFDEIDDFENTGQAIDYSDFDECDDGENNF